MHTGNLSRWAFMAVLVLVACGSTSCGLFSGDEPLNVIIVMVDTLRADHLGCHGHSRQTSPNMDAFAGQSVLFKNHYSTSSRTGPAVASMITGLYPRSHGVVNPLTHWDAKGTLGNEQITLAEILGDEGYACYGYITNPNVTGRFGFAQGFDEYHPVQTMRARDVNNAAMARVMEDPQRPFFLYLHYMEPHSPYRGPEAYRSLFLDRGYSGQLTGDHMQLDRIVAGELDVDAADTARLEGLYDQEIKGFDDEFQRLIRALQQEGLYDNTVIVLVGDHGEEFMDHGSVLHGYTLYEEQLRVPLVIRDPRRTEALSVDQVSRHTDLLPTLLDLLEIDRDAGDQGRSLVPVMDGAVEESSSAPVFAEVSLMAVKTVRKRAFMVDGWKVIETDIPAPGFELYDLNADPGETCDLSGERAEKLEDMTGRMRDFMDGLPLADSQTVQLNSREIEALRSLGYIK